MFPRTAGGAFPLAVVDHRTFDAEVAAIEVSIMQCTA
jgi:hypothetical protein